MNTAIPGSLISSPLANVCRSVFLVTEPFESENSDKTRNCVRAYLRHDIDIDFKGFTDAATLPTTKEMRGHGEIELGELSPSFRVSTQMLAGFAEDYASADPRQDNRNRFHWSRAIFGSMVTLKGTRFAIAADDGKHGQSLIAVSLETFRMAPLVKVLPQVEVWVDMWPSLPLHDDLIAGIRSQIERH